MDLSLPGGRFRWRNHRLYVVTQTRSDRSEAFPAARVIREQWDPTTSHQRGWTSGVRPRHHGVEAIRRTRTPLSLPNIPLPEQHHRAGASLHQEADYGEPRIPV